MIARYSRFNSHFRLGQLRQAVRNIPEAVRSLDSLPTTYTGPWWPFSPTIARIGPMKCLRHFLYPTAKGSAARPAFKISNNSPSKWCCVARPRLFDCQKRTTARVNLKSTTAWGAHHRNTIRREVKNRNGTFSTLTVNRRSA